MVIETFDADQIAEIRQILAEELGRPQAQISDAEVLAYIETLLSEEEADHPAAPHALFEQQVAAAPEALALLTEAGPLSYAELNRRADRIAVGLGRLGAPALALCLPRGADLAAAALGALKAGVSLALLDPALPPRRLAAMLRSVQPALLLAAPALVAALPEVRALALDELDSAAPLDLPPAAEHPPAAFGFAGALAVPLEGATLAARLAWLQDTFALDAADVVLHQGAPSLDALAVELLWPLAVGARVALAPAEADPAALLALIERQGVTVARLLPSALAGLLAAQPGGPLPATLRLVLSGGEPLRQSLVDALARRSQSRIAALYGPPESGMEAAVAICRPGEAREHAPLGQATGPRTLLVLDRHLQPTPPGLPGEICIAGADLPARYVGNPEASALRFATAAEAAPFGGRLLRTGDQGRLLPDGTLELVGATRRQAWVAGERVDLEEVEAALLADPAVDACAVLARTSAAGETVLVAYLVAAGPLVEERLAARLAELLPAPARPRALLPITALPLTPAGTLDGAALERLPVLDAGVATRWEGLLRSLPEVEQAAVLLQEQSAAPRLLHMSDLLPNWRAALSQRAESAAAAPSDEPQTLPGVPALVDGGPLLLAPDAPATLPEVLRRAAQSDTGALLYLLPDGTEHPLGEQRYAALLDEAERTLAGLRALGLRPQDKVIFQVPAARDFLPAFWACALGGFVPVPVSIAASYDDPAGAVAKLLNAWEMLEHPLVLAGASVAQAVRGAARRAGLDGFNVAVADELRAHAPDGGWHAARPDDLALLLLTSGSTGVPKAVMQTHRSLLSMVPGVIQHNGLDAGDVSLNWMPLDHVGGLVDFHIRNVYLGCRQIHAPTEAVLQEPLRWLDWIDRYRATITWAPNFAFGLINSRADELARRSWDLASMRAIVNAGEAIVGATARRFLELLAPHGLLATAMRPTWGMSETCSGATYSLRFRPDSPSAAGGFVEVGAPIPGLALRIVDAQQQVVDQGVIGRFQVKGPSVTPGYYQRPELNDEVFRDGWFETGDLAFLRDGQLTITGREKDTIIINGVNFYSHEIESVVEAVEGVAVSYTAACAVRDSGGDTDQLAIFFCPQQADDESLAELLKTCRAAVLRKAGVQPSYLIPLEPHEVPKTAIGKIQRSDLRRQFEAGAFDGVLRRIDLLLGNANTTPDWFFRRIWRRREPAATAQLAGLTLLLGAGELAAALGSALDRAGAAWAQAEPAAAAGAYAELLDRLQTQHGPLARIVYLAAYEAAPAPLESAEALEAGQARAAGLLPLLQALQQRHASEQSLRLYVVTGQAQPVYAGEPVAYAGALLPGLVKTIPQELPWLAAGLIDLPADRPAENATRLLAELRGSRVEREVAYRNRQRLVPRLQAAELPHERAQELPLRRGGVYLLTGGLGGLGEVLAAYLLRHYGARLLIVGRTALPERATWEAALAQPGPLADRIAALRGLEQAGGEVCYEAADVADLEALRAAVGRAQERWQRPLDGVFHLAGVSGERLLADEDAASFAATLRPKVAGAWAIDRLLRDLPGAICVLFSSATGFFGGATAGAYAAANTFLEALAHDQRARGIRSFCFAWSMWDELGMSRNYALAGLARARGYMAIGARHGLCATLVGLAHDQPLLFVGLDGSSRPVQRALEALPAPTEALTAFYTPRAGRPALAGLPKDAVLDRFRTPAPCGLVLVERLPLAEDGTVDRQALAALGQRGKRSDRTPPRNDAERTIARIWQDLLGVQQIGIYDNFFELGGDSILAIQVVARAAQAGLPITPQQLFQRPTVAALAEVAGSLPTIQAEQGVVTGPVPLMPSQHWFFDLTTPAPHHFNQAYMFEIRHAIPPEVVERAVGHLLAHHDALRLRFSRAGGVWQQHNAGLDEQVPFCWVDLSDRPADEQISAQNSAIAALQTSLDLAEGPILRVALFTFGPARPSRLAVIIHHLVIDGISWRLILEDLYDACQQIAAGQEVQLPPKTTSFKHWAERMVERARSDELRAELGYWLSPRRSTVAPLPVDFPEGVYTIESSDTVVVALDADETRALLQDVPRAFHTQINDVLLAAVLRACGRWSGAPGLLVDLVGHGREPIFEDVDLSRTVGWCSTTYPVLLERGADDMPEAALRAVHAQLQEVPGRGSGYGPLRYFSGDPQIEAQLRALPQPQVVFSYIGQVDQALAESPLFELVREMPGPLQDPRGSWPYLLDIYAHVVDGQLWINLLYSSNVYRRATVEHLADDVLAALRATLAAAHARAE